MKTLVGIAIKIIAFYYRLSNYVKVTNGKNIVNPHDVRIDTSLVWKGKVAPDGYVFYIAKLTLNGVFYSKNISINRRNISRGEESMLCWKAQRIFAEAITERINK